MIIHHTSSLGISTHCSSSHRKVRLSDLQYPSPAPALSRKLQGQKIPSKYYWLAGKHMNKVLRWAFMMYHRIDDRALFFSWVPCLEAVQCTALNSNQYFEGVVLFFEPNVCYKKKYTKRSSNTLLGLVYLFSYRTLVSCKRTCT